MRLRKDYQKISISKSDKIEFFRTLKLNAKELEELNALPTDERGFIETTEESEAMLLSILEVRQLGHLLYPTEERYKWSGFVKLNGDILYLV